MISLIAVLNNRAQALVCVCNLDNKPKIRDPYCKFNVRSKNNAHMQLLLSFITCLCICFSIFNRVTSLKQVPFFTKKKNRKIAERILIHLKLTS